MKDSYQRVNKSVYRKYPVSNIIIYNGTTVLHFLLAGSGLIIGYAFLPWDLGSFFGLLYLIFAFTQMYIIMPFTVCPNCVYYKMKNSRCTSGLNIVSKKIAKEGDLKQFSNRSGRLFCHNQLYMGALIVPIIILIPALIVNFSFPLLTLFLIVLCLLLFRFFVVFKITACSHCSAKYRCPNAKAMGIV